MVLDWMIYLALHVAVAAGALLVGIVGFIIIGWILKRFLNFDLNREWY